MRGEEKQLDGMKMEEREATDTMSNARSCGNETQYAGCLVEVEMQLRRRH